MADVYAFVDRAELAKPTIHTRNGRPMPHADIVIISTEPDGIFLYRYTAEGEFGGDTWHESRDAAADQARYEYGDALGEWQGAPDDVSDLPALVIEQLRNQGR